MVPQFIDARFHGMARLFSLYHPDAGDLREDHPEVAVDARISGHAGMARGNAALCTAHAHWNESRSSMADDGSSKCLSSLVRKCAGIVAEVRTYCSSSDAVDVFGQKQVLSDMVCQHACSAQGQSNLLSSHSPDAQGTIDGQL